MTATKSVLSYLATAVGILVLWQLVVVLFGVPPYVMPSARSVLISLGNNWSGGASLQSQTLVTLEETLLGLVAGIAIGFVLAVAIAASSKAAGIIYPVLVAMQSVPNIAVAPVLVIWIGTGLTPKVIISALVCVYVLIIDLALGLVSFEPNMILLARSMGASGPRIFLSLRIPNALPYFFSALKVAVTLALVGAVVGEFVGATQGLGFIVLRSLGLFKLDLMFAAIILLGALGLVLYGLVQLAERYAIPWSQGVRTKALLHE